MKKVSFAEITSRPATDSDISFLLALWKDVMSVHFVASGVPHSDEAPLQRLKNRFECGSVLSFNGQDIGFLKVARDGDNWQLIQVLLAPQVQRKGMGEFLIRRLAGEARTHGASLGLSVLKKNPAMKLYLRLGFRVVNEEKYAYEMQYQG